MKNTFKKCFALLMVVCLLVGSVPLSFAAGVTQVSTEKELQSAIANAASGDTIDVRANIALTSSVTVNGKVTVTSSNGSAILRASSYKSYMFTVAAGGELTLENITVNGNRTDYTTSELATEMILVQANGTLNFNDGTLLTTNRGNAAVSGGGITVCGVLNMNGGTIANIHMHNSDAARVMYGAAITVAGGQVNMNGGMIGGEAVGSAAQNDGRNGAVGVVSGVFNMYGGSISGNVANQQGSGAGGVHISNGATFNMYGGSVSNNNSRRNGGGFYNQGTLNIEGGVISGNTANFADEKDDPSIFFGGAIYNTGTISISGGEIKNNVARSCGGAIYSLGTVTISDGVISGNSSQRYSAGAIFVDGTGTLTVTGGTISGNTAGQFGGAIAVTSSASNALVITGGRFADNNCGASNCGSDIYITTSGSSNVTRNYVYECVTYTLYIDNVGSRYSASNKKPATSNSLTAGSGYVYAASGDGHSFGDWTTVKAADCTNAGSEKRTCVNCGKEETRTVPALGHSYDAGKTVKAATCTETGSVLYTCTRCGSTKTETIPAKGHTPGNATRVEPTCTEAGSTSYVCTVCSKTISETIPALGHDLKTTRVEATCTSDGYVETKCARCQTVMSHTILKAKGHTPGEWKVTVEPTKTSTGLKELCCSVCGTVLETEVLPVIPDPTVEIGTVAAERAEKSVKVPVSYVGNEGVWSMGFYVYYSSELELKGVLNGDVFRSVEASPYNVSPAENARAKAAFEAAGVSTNGLLCYRYYTQNGLYENVTKDGTLFTLVFDLPDSDTYEYEIGIVPVEGLCVNVDVVEAELIYNSGMIRVPSNDPCDHVAGPFETTKEATCTEDGIRVRYCTNCGKVMESEPVPALGHSFSAPVVTKPATCTEAGEAVSTCSRCAETVKTVIPAAGHKPGEWVEEVPAGPTTAGLRTKRCTVCNELLASEKIPATETAKIVVSSAEAEGGKDVSLNVSLEYNPGVWGMVLYVYYDEALELKSVSAGDVFKASEITYDKKVFNASPASNPRAQAAFAECGVTADGRVITAVYFESGTLDGDVTASGVILNMTFATPDVKEAVYEVGVVYSAEDVYDMNYNDVTYERLSGEVVLKEVVCDHNWSAWTVVTAADCENAGSEERTCSVCGKVETKAVPAFGHDYDDGVITEQASCTKAGTKTFTCSRCKKTYTESIPTLGHSMSEPVTVDATCTKAGSVTTTCTRCGEVFTQVIPAKGHTPGEWEIESETEMVQKCTVCGEVVGRKEITADPVIQVLNASAMCGSSVTVPVQITGNPGFWAIRLYVYYDEALTLTNVVNGTVVSDGEIYISDYNMLPSSNADAVEAFAACNVPTSGMRYVCIYVESDNLAKDITATGKLVDLTFTAPENAGEYAVGLAGLIEDDFYNQNDETVNFALEAASVSVTKAPPHVHVAGAPTVTPATCTENGSVVTKCTVCGEIMSETVIPATGHIAGEWEVVTPAGDTTNGRKVIKCTVCGAELRSEVIFANNATVVTVSEQSVNVNEKFETSVSISNNKGVWGLRLYLVYDAALELEDVVNGSVFAASEMIVGDMNEDATNSFYADVFKANGISPAGKKVTCVYFESSASKDNTANGELFKALFAGIANAGEYDIITIKEDIDAFDWATGANVSIAHDNGFVTVTEDVPAIKGDVDGNGRVDMEDMRLLRSYVAGLVRIENIVFEQADMNDDGKITAVDVMMLKDLLAS